MKLCSHTILRLILAFMPVMLALAPARAQEGNVVYAGQSSWLVVEDSAGVTYFWELYNDVTGLNLVVVPGNCPPAEAYFVGGVDTGDSVEVMWLVPGIYFFKVTGTDSCTNNIKVGRMEVLDALPVAVFLDPAPVCEGETAVLTLEITGDTGPWTVEFTDGTTVWPVSVPASPWSFPLIPTPTVPGSYEYWVTSVTDNNGITNDTPGEHVILIVHPKPVTSPITKY